MVVMNVLQPSPWCRCAEKNVSTIIYIVISSDIGKLTQKLQNQEKHRIANCRFVLN